LLDELPAAEAAHLAFGNAAAAAADADNPPRPAPAAAAPSHTPRGARAAPPAAAAAEPAVAARPSFQFSYSMSHDGTTACQLSAASALVQWPFLCDVSLVSAAASIFLPNWGRPPPPLGSGLVLRRWPWLYFNAVLRDSQVSQQ
jgi:hypothetical protein